MTSRMPIDGHVRICGGPGWATTQVYPVREAPKGLRDPLPEGISIETMIETNCDTPRRSSPESPSRQWLSFIGYAHHAGSAVDVP